MSILDKKENEKEKVDVNSADVGELPLDELKLGEPTTADTLDDLAKFFATEVTVTVGQLLEVHRKLGFCKRGSQRPAVLACEQDIILMLPDGTPIIYAV